MSDKPSLLERLMGSAKNKADDNKGALEAEIKAKLKGILYDEELVNELAPVFMKLQGVDGFNQVFELLETKERQIEAMSGGDWFKQETNPDKSTEEQTTEDSASLVDQILSKKYEGK
jgi:hypothetical protein